MGAFDDYITGLEGKDNVDPLEIAKELNSIHMQELGIREAKIETLNNSIAEKDTKIGTLTSEVTRQKAINFDLVGQVPVEDESKNTTNSDSKPDGGSIQISDLFNENIRAKHFRK